MIAGELNKYFVSVFSKEVIINIPKVSEKLNIECPNPSFAETILQLYIEKLDVHKAVGVDYAHPKVLKMCAKSICKPLSLIFIESFESGVVPELWRKANIVPLFKKGSKLEPSNYRPICGMQVLRERSKGNTSSSKRNTSSSPPQMHPT